MKNILPTLRHSVSKYFYLIALIGSFLGIIFILDINYSFKMRVSIVISSFLIPFIGSFIYTLLVKTKKIKYNSDKNLIIKFGDLLEQHGIIIIPVNCYFDTLINDKIISEVSIHGQFIKKFFAGNTIELDNLITESLEKQKIFFEVIDRNIGKNRKYPIGTIAQVNKNGNIYYLLASTYFDDNHVAYCSLKEYYFNIITLIEYLNINSQGKNVSIPLIGSGFARLKKKREVILKNLISIFRMTDIPLKSNVDIVLSESDLNEINLESIIWFFKFWK